MSQSSLRDVLVDVPEALNVGFLIERFQRVYHDQFPDDCVVQLRSVDVFVSVLTLPWTYTLSWFWFWFWQSKMPDHLIGSIKYVVVHM